LRRLHPGAEAVLGHLRENKVPGLEITRGGLPVYRSRDPRAATVYRVHLRLTLQPHQRER
jgi:hypothetical protein